MDMKSNEYKLPVGIQDSNWKRGVWEFLSNLVGIYLPGSCDCSIHVSIHNFFGTHLKPYDICERHFKNDSERIHIRFSLTLKIPTEANVFYGNILILPRNTSF